MIVGKGLRENRRMLVSDFVGRRLHVAHLDEPHVLPHTAGTDDPARAVHDSGPPSRLAVRLPLRAADPVAAVPVRLVGDEMHRLDLPLGENEHILERGIVTFRFGERAGVFHVNHGVKIPISGFRWLSRFL